MRSEFKHTLRSREIRRLLEVSPLCQPVSDDTDVDQLFATYDAVLRDIADKLAPAHSTRRRPADRRRGSTLSVEQYVVNVDASSAVTAARAVQRITGTGWMPRVTDFDCTS